MLKFQVGDRAFNEKGWYSVISQPVHGKMTVKYDTGEPAMLLEGLEFSHLREAKTYERSIIRNEDYYIALGFLAQNSFILAKMMPNKFSEFSVWYKEMTNRNLDENSDGLQIVDNDNQWGLEMRITFPKAVFNYLSGVNFEEFIAEKEGDSFQCQISMSKWVKELILLGFRVGNSHNLDKISQSIPKKYMDSFLLGYETSKELNNSKICKTMICPVRTYK